MPQASAAKLIADPLGAYPAATVACFDPTTGPLPRRRLDRERNSAFLEALAKAGAEAVLIGASTGWGHARTTDELAQWFRSSAEARVGDMVKMVLLRPEDRRQAASELIALAAELGYQVVFVRPGTDLARDASAERVAQNMQPIVEEAAAAGLAVGLYSIPDVSGLPMPVEAAVRLVEGSGGESIVAVKVTEADYEQSTLRFLQEKRLAHLKIVQGWDPHLARALADGPRYDARGKQRCGITSGPMSLAVFQYTHILAATERGDGEEVDQAQAAVTALFASMQDDPRKFADLQRAKYVMGLGHPLTAEVATTQAERLLSALESLSRKADRARLARSLDLLGDGPFHERLARLYD